MTYSYPGPLSYGQNYPTKYEGMTKQSSSSSYYGVGGLLVGAGVGGFIGYKTNPIISKNGKVSDSFTRKVYDKYIESAKDTEKKCYKEGLDILESIDKVSTPEELKALANKNPEAMKQICSDLGKSPDDFLQNVTKDNLSNNKNVIKDKINTGNKARYQDMENRIQACWNKDKKTFEKPSHVAQEIFDAIKSSTKGLKAKIIAKYAAIGGLATGTAAIIAKKIISAKKNKPASNEYGY